MKRNSGSGIEEGELERQHGVVAGLESGVVGFAQLLPGYAVPGQAGEYLALTSGAGKRSVEPLSIFFIEGMRATA